MLPTCDPPTQREMKSSTVFTKPLLSGRSITVRDERLDIGFNILCDEILFKLSKSFCFFAIILFWNLGPNNHTVFECVSWFPETWASKARDWGTNKA